VTLTSRRRVFDGAGDAAISLLPLTYTRNGERMTPVLGAVAAANSVQAYQHLMRLAWPTVPPMTRAPFVQLPDFVVVGPGVWRMGAAGMKAAGFYSADWMVEPSMSFSTH
jgi:hypothetical protein